MPNVVTSRTPLRIISRERHQTVYLLCKRAFDLFVVLLLAVPVLVVVVSVAILGWVRLRPAFFAHKRVGQDGVEFQCWKLRTMVPDAETILHKHLQENPDLAREWLKTCKLADDPRVTPLGRILRKTSMDELPQLWNVFRGDMSVVGPRPVPKSELRLYDSDAAAYLSVKPGITGLWQVSGRNTISYRDRVTLDASYARQASLGLDFQICLRTFPALFKTPGY